MESGTGTDEEEPTSVLLKTGDHNGNETQKCCFCVKSIACTQRGMSTLASQLQGVGFADHGSIET